MNKFVMCVDWCDGRGWTRDGLSGSADVVCATKAEVVEAWSDGKEVAIVGEPQDGHNCDQMGCGSIGSHVTNRCPLHAREKVAGRG